jgi:hypothetical protein
MGQIRRAKRVDLNHAEIRDNLRNNGYTVFDTHDMGGGFPDLVVQSKTHISILVEIKRAGENLTAKEVTFFNEWGFSPLEIFYSTEDALQKMKRWDERLIVWQN